MSINALANAAAARRPDFFPLNKTPVSLREIAQAARTPASTESQAPDGAEPRASPAQMDTALHSAFWLHTYRGSHPVCCGACRDPATKQDNIRRLDCLLDFSCSDADC